MKTLQTELGIAKKCLLDHATSVNKLLYGILKLHNAVLTIVHNNSHERNA
jgi:hypothetical protein